MRNHNIELLLVLILSIYEQKARPKQKEINSMFITSLENIKRTDSNR